MALQMTLLICNCMMYKKEKQTSLSNKMVLFPQDLYQAVWQQVSRLVSPLPPTEAQGPNHAHDW